MFFVIPEMPSKTFVMVLKKLPEHFKGEYGPFQTSSETQLSCCLVRLPVLLVILEGAGQVLHVVRTVHGRSIGQLRVVLLLNIVAGVNIITI